MHILEASIKLNQVIMRLSFFRVFFPLMNISWEEEFLGCLGSQALGDGVLMGC